MYVCTLNQAGKFLVHRNLRCDRERSLAIVKPYRRDLAVAVERLFCWYWLADLCAEEGIALVLVTRSEPYTATPETEEI